MLMFDRIININSTGGENGKGEIIAELDVILICGSSTVISRTNRVMPGCLGPTQCGNCGILSGLGRQPGRGALGAGEVKFTGQVTPRNKLITYRISMKRVIQRKLNMGIADGVMEVDDGRSQRH